MPEPLPNPDDKTTPAAGETLLEITTPGDQSSPGETLLALDGRAGNESVLSRVDRATGSNLSTRPVELKTGELQDTNPSQAATRPTANDFTTRATGGARNTARYVSAAELGRGGMGVVLKVRDADLRREVAMKVVRADRAQPGTQSGNAALRRFIEEAQITGQLEHPNIVPVHELGADADGRVYFTMKLVRGRPLSDVVKALRGGDTATLAEFPLDRLLQVFMKVCDALSFAHAHSVIHRDLKPENIMLGQFGEVLVMDWGLARILNQPEAPGLEIAGTIETDSSERKQSGDSRPSALSMEGTIAGTPAYMAPEQARGQVSRIDQTTDVFALGAMLYELLILRPPYQGEGGTQIIERAAEGEIVPPAERAAKDPELRALLPRLPGGKVPAELEAIAMHALSYRQEKRYQTAKALKDDIENFMAGRPVTVREDPLPVRAAKWVRRHPTLSMSSAAACAVILVSVASIMFLVAQARKEALEQEGQLLATSKLAEDEATRRAKAESETAARERELKDAALSREDAMVRRAKAAEVFRVGTEQADRAREIIDPTLRDEARKEAVVSLEKAARADADYVDPWFALGRLHHYFFDQRALDCYVKVDDMSRQSGRAGDARSLVYAGDFARLQLSDAKLARDYYERASKIAPDDPLALVGKGYVELLDGEFGAALGHARQARALDSSLWEPFMLEGFVRASVFKRGDRELNPEFDAAEAEDLLTQGLLRSNREGMLFNERGAARLELGRIADAHQDFMRANELMPGAIEPRINLSICLMRQSRLQESIYAVQELIDAKTESVQAWMQYGTVLVLYGEFEKGTAALRKSLELKPGRPAPLTNLGLAHLWHGEFDQAVAFANQALEAEKDYAGAHLLLCEALLCQRKFEQALAAIDNALALRPGWSVAEVSKAKALSYAGRFEEALEVARRAVKGQPELDEAWCALGLAEQGLGNTSVAAEHHRKAVDLNPRSALALLNLAICLKLQGKIEEARGYAEQACAYPGLGARPHFEVGDCQLLAGRFEPALAKYLKAIELEPGYGDAWINSAVCANRLGRPKEARDYAVQATRFNPTHVLSWVQLCQSEISLKDFAAAGKAVDKAKELETTDPTARCDVGAMLYTLGRTDEAIEIANEVAGKAPQYARPYELLANCFINQKKYEQALAARAEQSKRDPTNPFPWASSAVLLHELKRYDEAIKAGKRALGIDPGNATAHNYMGHARLALKQYDLAVESYEAAARADATDAWPWVNMGVARIQQGRLADAIVALKQAGVADEKNDTGWYYLGLCYKDQRKWEEALDAYSRAVAANPSNLDAMLEAAGAGTEAGKYEEAEKFAFNASQLAPKDMRVWYRLGMVHFDQGQYASAAKAFAKGTEVAPTNQWLHYLLAAACVETGEYARAKESAKKCIEIDDKVPDARTIIARCELVGDQNLAEALKWLREAIEKGADAAGIYAMEWTKPLHETEGWKKLKQDFPPK